MSNRSKNHICITPRIFPTADSFPVTFRHAPVFSPTHLSCLRSWDRPFFSLERHPYTPFPHSNQLQGPGHASPIRLLLATIDRAILLENSLYSKNLNHTLQRSAPSLLNESTNEGVMCMICSNWKTGPKMLMVAVSEWWVTSDSGFSYSGFSSSFQSVASATKRIRMIIVIMQ